LFLHTNIFCFCTKTQLEMFQLYLCLEWSYTQTISFHCTPSLLHIPKMMNATMTLQPMTKYSTHLFLFFLTPLLLMLFSTILLPPHAFDYVGDDFSSFYSWFYGVIIFKSTYVIGHRIFYSNITCISSLES
jgi:hypothetical protein